MTESALSQQRIRDWFKDAWHLARPYWKSSERKSAWTLLIASILFTLSSVAMTVVLNYWHRYFYNALQRYDVAAFQWALVLFTIIVFIYIGLSIASFYCRKILEIRWRKWLTDYYIARWMHTRAYYNSQFTRTWSDNPDQRISQDIGDFISMLLTITLDFLSAMATMAAFIVVLWNLSGLLPLSAIGLDFGIPGYMVWAALLYAVIGTWITFKIGRPLINLNYQQQQFEADFRFGLMRVREHNENIAFYEGEPHEHKQLDARFRNVFRNFVNIVHRQLKINLFGISYNQAAVVFPLIVAAPKYFARHIQLGGLMQISSAFGQVQSSMSYFINIYSTLATWRATMNRLSGFERMIAESDNLYGLTRTTSADAAMHIRRLSVYTPEKAPLIENLDIKLTPGERLLIRGPSGSGKTTMLRTLAGLWPFCQGELAVPDTAILRFIAQKPYLPYDEFKAAVCYPQTGQLPDDEHFCELLKRCCVGHLSNCLGSRNDWNHTLSVGEQQRLAFCRLLNNPGSIIFLDEATSAVDEATEAILYEQLCTRTADSIIISIAHRSTLKDWHTRTLDIEV